MQCRGLCSLLPHKNTLVTRTRDGHCFLERTKFLRTNEIFRKWWCRWKNERWTNNMDCFEKIKYDLNRSNKLEKRIVYWTNEFSKRFLKKRSFSYWANDFLNKFFKPKIITITCLLFSLRKYMFFLTLL